jgi:hypothetical protein
MMAVAANVQPIISWAKAAVSSQHGIQTERGDLAHGCKQTSKSKTTLQSIAPKRARNEESKEKYNEAGRSQIVKTGLILPPFPR